MQAQGLFQPRTDQLIYVEDEYHEAINQTLLREYQSILAVLEKTMKQVHFVFMPQLFKDTEARRLLSASIGWDWRTTFARFDYFTSAFLSRLLLSKSDFSGTLSPGLFRFTGEKGEEGQYVFEYFPFDLSALPSLVQQCARYAKTIRVDLPPRKSSAGSRGLSIYEWMMAEAGGCRSDSIYDQLSPLLIQETKKKGGGTAYRILLPAYDNLEIKMPPLPKALYILFLRHPEGIVLSSIADYREELLTIYKRLSPRADAEGPVERLCSLSDNSIHEKLSQIKAAFVLPEKEHKKQYIVETMVESDKRVRGEAIGILLNRSLLTLPASLERIHPSPCPLKEG
jgi:hypothetical protein